MSDKPLTKCPKCGKDTFVKQLSAPGFELKGKGWAATDFNAGHTGVAAAHTKNK
jgi:predicted nucleic acid-binding Zn ribbon protein